MARAAEQTRKRTSGRQGFTLIEVLVAVVLLVICLLGVVQFFASAGNRVMDSETRSVLHQVASQEIESIRSLPYEEVGTVGGHPSGVLPQSETRTVDGIPIEITREIIYIQDPSYSGPFPANYRHVTVTVRATDSPELQPVQVSTFVAGGAQGGTLDITVTNLRGEAVPAAYLRITDDILVPRVDIHASAIRTDNNGHLLVPGLTPDPAAGYFVTASKSGYNTATKPDTSQGLAVLKGQTTQVSLVIDELCSLIVHLTDETGAPRPGVALSLSGRLSTSPWSYSVEQTTNAEGYATFSDLRYATSLEPCVIQTSVPFSPVLQLPPDTEPDPIDPSIASELEPGQIGLMLAPGATRNLELQLPNP